MRQGGLGAAGNINTLGKSLLKSSEYSVSGHCHSLCKHLSLLFLSSPKLWCAASGFTKEEIMGLEGFSVLYLLSGSLLCSLDNDQFS
jgi:hypothetical protein